MLRISDTGPAGTIKATRLIRTILGRRGSEMAEAAISLPIAILTALLFVRVFSFYLEILDTGAMEHRKALEEWDSYKGSTIRTYTSTETVWLVRGGVLARSVSKRIDTRMYLLSEDAIVRAGEIF